MTVKASHYGVVDTDGLGLMIWGVGTTVDGAWEDAEAQSPAFTAEATVRAISEEEYNRIMEFGGYHVDAEWLAAHEAAEGQ